MTDAPERIWIEDERPVGGKLHVFTDPPVKGAEKYVVEYIPRAEADRQTQEAMAAERERCAKVAERWLARDMHEAMTPGALEQNEIARQIAAAIREGGK